MSANQHVRDAIAHGDKVHTGYPQGDPQAELARRFALHYHATTNDLAPDADPGCYRDALAFAAMAMRGAAEQTAGTQYREGLALASNVLIGMACHMSTQAQLYGAIGATLHDTTGDPR